MIEMNAIKQHYRFTIVRVIVNIMKITKIAKQTEYNNYVDFEDVLNFDMCWELVKSHVKSNNIRISGIEHQERYLPVIDDKYIFLLSQRVWGELMSEAWSTEDNVNYKYSNWAWWTPEETKGGEP